MASGFKKATVNAAKVAATATDFPSYVDLSRLGITTLAEAQSVRVYADLAKTVEWAREIVSVTECHFLVPSITTTTDVYIDYDGVRADYAVGDTYGAQNVWSGYDGAWHLQGTTDSAGTYDMTITNATSGAAGKIGNAYDFPKTADERGQSTTSAPTTLNTWTASAWVKMDTLVNYAGIFHKLSTTRDGAGANQNFILIVHNDGKIGANPGGSWVFSSAASITTATWYKLDWVRSGSIISYYVDGVAKGTSTYANTNSAGFKYGIGAWYSGNQSYSPDGIIDSVRMTQTSQSADWITTEYNNQNDESAFWGTWTDAGGGGGFTPTPQMHMMSMV